MSYTGDKLKVMSKCFIICYKSKKPYEIQFNVTNYKRKPILEAKISVFLKLVKRIDESSSGWVNPLVILDATQGFYHIKLDKSSANLCTFWTPYGRYKILRMPYGLASDPEVFQQRFEDIFDLKGLEVSIDVLIVWGRNQEERDKRLEKVFDIARKNGVQFNLQEYKLGEKSVKYLGRGISEIGITPYESKIQAILHMPSPKNKNEAFKKWKSILTSKPVWQFFYVNKDTVLSIDASESGLGTVLLQNKLPCVYASKAMA